MEQTTEQDKKKTNLTDRLIDAGPGFLIGVYEASKPEINNYVDKKYENHEIIKERLDKASGLVGFYHGFKKFFMKK